MARWLVMDDGTRLRVVDEGSGPIVVLVHGWKGTLDHWDETAQLLVASGHRVIRVDHRWMGQSDKPGGPYSIDVLAHDLRSVLDQLDVENATLVGWSMGCSVALRLLELGCRGVAGLVLHNGPLCLVARPDFPHAMSADQLDQYLRDLAEAWPESERSFQAESLLDPVREDLLERLHSAAVAMPLEAMIEIVRSQAQLDLRAAVRRLRVPVLAAYSDRDPYYPPSLATFIAGSAPDGAAHLFRDSAHCTPLEEPEAFAHAVSTFVDQVVLHA